VGNFNRVERDNIEALRRRARWLAHRFSKRPDYTFDGQELRAIEWALRELEKARGPLPAEVIEDEEPA
jgi:hypothetical protein